MLPFRPTTPATVSPSELATLALDDTGLIRDCSAAAERLFEYRRDDVLGRHVSALLPALAATELTRGEAVDPRLAYLSRFIPFEARRRDGERFSCELFFNSLRNPGGPPLLVIVREAAKSALPRR